MIVDFDRGGGTLQLLAIQHLRLKYADGLASADLCFGDAPVAAAIAGGDEIGNAAALKKGAVLHGFVVQLAEAAHLVQSDANDGRLCVFAKSEAVDKAGSQGNDIFQGAAELDAMDVADESDAKVARVKEVAKDESVVLTVTANGRLAKLFLGDFVCEIGAHEDRDVNAAKRLFDRVRDEGEAFALHIYALDEGDGAGGGMQMSLQTDAQSVNKLVRDDKDEQRGVLGGGEQIGLCDNVVGQFDSRKISMMVSDEGLRCPVACT